jgi:excisionase family DNA binding protein
MTEEKRDGKDAAQEKRLFTVNDACAYLSISRMSLYRLIQQKEILPLTIAGRTLFDRRDLDDLIERSKDEGGKKRQKKPG